MMTSPLRHEPILVTAAVLLLAGGGFLGCSSGGSSGGGGTAPAGVLSTALDTPNRNAAGYSFQAVSVGSLPGTAATALGVAPAGTASLVTLTPGNQVAFVDNGQTTLEGTLVAPPTSIASVTTAIFVATGQRGTFGAGEVYARADQGGSFGWSLVLDSDHEQLEVAAANGYVVAVGGSLDADGVVYRTDSGGAFSSVATIPSAMGTAAVGYRGQVYVGTTSSAAGGGSAGLWRLGSAGLEQVALPAASTQAGVRQEVTAFLTVDTVATANPTQTTYLVIAVGSFDVVSGDPVGGSVQITDGDVFETLATYSQDAPTCLAFADQTLYAGMASGELRHRLAGGSWQAVTGLSAGAIESLLVRGGSLLVGVESASGAAVLVRTPNAATPGAGNGGGTGSVPPTTDSIYYEPHVMTTLRSACTVCHADAAQPAYAAYAITGIPRDDTSYANTVSKVDLSDAEGSLLVVKARGGLSHVAALSETDPGFGYLVNWVRQGARRSSTATSYTTFRADVLPILNTQCDGCHSGGAGGYSTPSDAVASYNEFNSYVNPNDPAGSEMLLKNDGTRNHNGGAAWAVGSPARATILQYIADGLRYNQ